MKYILLFILMLSCCMALAMQADDPGLPGDDPDLPVDGGLTVLLIAGAAYGLRKINQQRIKP
jgi:hypothetical protein